MQLFFNPNKNRVQDIATGRNKKVVGYYSNDTLEQMKNRTGANIILIDKDEALERQECSLRNRLVKQPIEIDEKTWYEMLGQLPPKKWKNNDLGESFLCPELIAGSIGSFYVRLNTPFGEKFFTLNESVDFTHEAAIAKCQKAFFENQG
jgi:hypothetical protein